MRLELGGDYERGIERARRQLNEIGPGVWYLAVADGLAAYGRVLAKDVKGRLPSRSGRTKASIRNRRGYPRFEPSQVIRAGRAGRLLDTGTEPRYQRSGKYTGISPAKGYIDAAIESTRQPGALAFVKTVNRALPRIIRQLEAGKVPRRVQRVLS